MKDGKGRKRCQVDAHLSKHRDAWVAHFDCALHYAENHVGKIDARAVANDALWDAYRSKRERPSLQDHQAFCEWLMYFVYWRIRTYRSRKSRERKQASSLLEEQHLFEADHVPPHSDVIHDRLTLAKALEHLSLEEQNLVCQTHILEYSSCESARALGVNPRTLQRRVAEATTSLRVFVERRLKEVRYGVTILWPFPDVASFLRKIFTFTSRSFVRAMHTMPHVGVCSISLMVGGLVPGGTSSPTRPAILMGRPSRAESPAAPPIEGRSSPSIPINAEPTGEEKKTSPPIGQRVSTKPRKDKPVAQESNPAPPPPVAAAADVIDVRASAVLAAEPVRVPPPNIAIQRIPKPEAMNEQSCDAAFSKAQAVMNHHRDAQSCLAYLNEKPNGTDTCPETVERKTLRRRCSDN